MSMLIDIIRSAAKGFDDRKYPSDVYYHLLEQIRSASTPADLGDALSQALAWKDGKIRRDPNGPYVAFPSNTRYRVEQTKPNTLNENHRQIISSDDFYAWATRVREMQHFDVALVHDLDRRFGLWASVVIPVFVLHCLRPQIYPIVDRWVLTAYSILDSECDEPLDTTMRSCIEVYARYQAWWLRLLGEAGLGPMSAQLNQLKEIDAGLWVLGKRAAAIAKELGGEDVNDMRMISTSGSRPSELGTDSDEFKLRAIAIRNSGKTQRQAILDAAVELGIELKPSYINYPGSHFERWRKQGLE